MIQDGQLVKFVNGGDAARIQKVQIAVGRDATRAPRVRHDLRGMPVQVVTGEDATRAPYIHPFEGLSPAAWFRMDQGVTVTGAGISQIDDLSGNARHLLDPGTTRPIYLPYSGTKYLYLPGVAGNYASTPDSAANSITGDIDIRVRVALDDWTPASPMTIAAKYLGGSGISWLLLLNTAGTLGWFMSSDGTTSADAGKNSTVAVGATDGSIKWVRVTKNSSSGDIQYFTSDDGDSWTQLGTTVAGAASAPFDGGSPVTLGAYGGGGSLSPMAGRIYRAIIKNGIDGTTVVDFNPADASNGATSFASSATGETWTVNSSGSLPAQIVGRASALFNGTSHYLKCNAFTLNQPTCVLMVVKQVSWTSFEYIFDGNASASGALIQNASSPNIRLTADGAVSFTDQNGGLTVGAVGVVASVFNGASSLTRVNNGSPATGNPGAGNMGGFTLASRGTPGALSHIQVYENVIFPIAPSTAQLDRLVAGLMARHGVA